MVDNLSSPPRTRPGGRSGYSPTCSPESRPNYSSSSQYMISTPLTIRGAPMDLAPPPLPPPRYAPVVPSNKQLWLPHEASVQSPSLSLAPGSSLMGGWNRPDERLSVPRRANIQMPNSPLRNSERAVKKEEEDVELFPSLTAKFDEPRPFELRNQRNTTNAYDKHQLSKLGRPKTPTRSSTIGSIESSPIASHRLRLDTQASLHKLTLAERPIGSQPSDSPYRTSSPFGRWTGHTHSGAFSPSMMSTATSSQSMAELRSPTYEPSTAPSSLATDNNVFSRVGSIDQGSNASLSLLSSAFDESERDLKRMGHVTRDRGADLGAGRFGQSDRDSSDFAVQHGNARTHYGETRECTQQRHSDLDSHMADAAATAQKGLKRKASPSDVSADEPVAQTVRSHTPGRSTKRTSPVHQSGPLQTSFGSLSTASPRNASYASTNLSLAPSSVTSMGSQERSSPGGLANGVSESVEARHSQSPYGRPMSLEPSIRALPGHVTLPPLSVQAQANAALQQEMATKRGGNEVGAAKPPLANIHMCDCCPKKPKKFPTLEALQAHQNEKQYQCNFCLNRFKNKNEAERHQNSLHLRKQSWSCAALENHYEKAFHACTAVPSGTSTQIGAHTGHASGAEYDICGYCGKQFPNYPNPDWMERGKHLTEVHKFGECNQSKKFFRADHFRQHLKHSHEGVPGKWTNMLETACLRDEPPPQPIDHQAQDKLRHQQQYNQIQANQALQAVQQQNASQTPAGPYSVESAQPSCNTASVPTANTDLADTHRNYPMYPSQPEEPNVLSSRDLRPS